MKIKYFLYFLVPFITLIILVWFSSILYFPSCIPLFPEGIPCKDVKALTINKKPPAKWMITEVNAPELEVYKPWRFMKNGTAVVICPGGGYGVLGWQWEGTEIAKWLARNGTTAFVLKYRLPKKESIACKSKVALHDAKRALRTIRKNAIEWGIHKDKIGIIGFSAGGHLAASLSCHFNEGDPSHRLLVEKESCRPDFAILMYPVISMEDSLTNIPTRKNLLTENPDSALIDFYSLEKQIPPNAPPTLLFHTADDKEVQVENSLLYFKELQEKQIPSSIHIFETGGHGFSKGGNEGQTNEWRTICENWLVDRGLIN